MHHLHLDNLFRSNEAKGMIAGRGIATSAGSVVRSNCQEVGKPLAQLPYARQEIYRRMHHAGQAGQREDTFWSQRWIRGRGAALGGSGAPFTRPPLTATQRAISRERHAHRVARSPLLLCSTPIIILLMTTKSRLSISTTISAVDSCG